MQCGTFTAQLRDRYQDNTVTPVGQTIYCATTHFIKWLFAVGWHCDFASLYNGWFSLEMCGPMTHPQVLSQQKYFLILITIALGVSHDLKNAPKKIYLVIALDLKVFSCSLCK